MAGMTSRWEVWEMSLEKGEPTGERLTFSGITPEEVAHNALYTAKLKNGNAYLGPTGRVVYPGGGLAWVVVPA